MGMGNSLPNLHFFSIADNQFNGTIPTSISNASNLEFLDLCANNLTGRVSSLDKFHNFANPSIEYNNFGGELPEHIANFSKELHFFVIQHNQISGNIPVGIQFLVNLEVFIAERNKLSGTIPSGIWTASKSKLLHLGGNNLPGYIPSSLGNLTNLLQIALYDDNLQGSLPKDVEILKNLGILALHENMLSGEIPSGLGSCTSKIPEFLKGFNSIQLLDLSYTTSGFSSNNLIGIGSFGAVYKGILDQEGMVIAVKVLNLTRQGASKSFITECEALRNVRHRNLVKVLTACPGVDYQGNDCKALVYDFMVNGSLDVWLHLTLGLDEVVRILNVIRRLNIAIDVASALEYLHYHCGTPIVHCDLKPSNVLLDEEMISHVGDFGLVRFLANGMHDYSTNQSSSLGIRRTIGYCPLEMFMGKRPTDDMFKKNLTLHGFVKRGLPEQVKDIIDANLYQMQFNTDATSNHNHTFGNRRNNIFMECLISALEFGISCSMESPQERMNISDVIAQLSSIRNKLVGIRLPRKR
ncbi:probable LRR receptor-like serine/threonine-protein kinase At3g47570 [Hevea brasiliensis]|uniref:probable LRR receptor-like serine/threonine-protein kinase At3g47570 n=1 Tax=Hevea brasiliensis TaxID=3981 RepID=UPI0025DF9350|nr:probable LRR receptor-like serine/threonine-protein kinase At3g47570 [Hevea brasiliensis]